MAIPSFLSIIDRQRHANNQITNTRRTEPERAMYRRTVEPVPLEDVEIPKLPLVRTKSDQKQYVAIGEIAQTSGKVVLMDINDGTVSIHDSNQLELIPPQS